MCHAGKVAGHSVRLHCAEGFFLAVLEAIQRNPHDIPVPDDVERQRLAIMQPGEGG